MLELGTIAKLGVGVGIAVGVAGAVLMGAHSSTPTAASELAAIRSDIADIKSDVRLLKCKAGFREGCPVGP